MPSHTCAPATRRELNTIIHRVGAKLAGRERGPDATVRRSSFDIDDDRAKPWSPIGDGTPGAGLAFTEALLQTADELRRKEWEEQRAGDRFVARLEAESTVLTVLTAGEAVFAPGMIVRGAGIAPDTRVKKVVRSRLGQSIELTRPALASVEAAELTLFLDRLRRVDVTVLGAILAHLDFRTGRLFPTLQTIADHAACSVRSVVNAIRRLVERGFIAYVRRSVATGNDGQFAPQREQTSNAYFFEHKARMAKAVWGRFQTRLVAKLRRLGGARRPAPAVPVPTPPPNDPELRATLARMARLVPPDGERE